MNRRKFLHTGLWSSIPLMSLSLPPSQTMSGVLPQLSADSLSLEEITLSQLESRLDSGELNSVQLVAAYLLRISEIDDKIVGLHAIIELNPEAVHIATSLDEERKNGKKRGPLHGIPVLIKDNIDTADFMHTTAGSLALSDNIARKDAYIIQKLREAGAIILGKTNLSEWANFRSTRSSSGWSSRGGQTLNPYLLDRSPGGSSSGSGAAVAANLCAIAIGTETNGSIACPAAVNGIVGIKPTVGLWSRSGIIPISHTQDTAGPMARTVKDAALLLSLLAGFDDEDEATQKMLEREAINYTDFCSDTRLDGVKIGVEKKYLQVHEGVDALMQEALDTMRMLGAQIIEVEVLKMMDDLWAEETIVLETEFKEGINKYLNQCSSAIKSLQDVISYNQRHEREVMPYFKQEILESAAKRGDLLASEYEIALNKLVNSARIALDSVIDHHGLSAIIGPSNNPAWCIDLINGDFFGSYASYALPAVAGYPHITVPMGFVGPLPMGLTMLGKAWSEGELIRVAYTYEQATHHRRPPSYMHKM